MNLITKKNKKEQLREDIIGKDAFRGTTLTYAFLANQFGHFSLGFIPTIIPYLLAERYNWGIKDSVWIMFIVGLFWFFFEMVNYYTSVFKDPRYPFLHFKIKKFPFVPSWGNLISDLVTDIGFFWVGSIAAAAFFVLNMFGLLLTIAFLGFLIPLALYWFTTRMYLQNAGYPHQYRLSQWELKVYDRVKWGVHNFRNAEFSGTHLFIFGSDTDVNSMLAVAIATEFSFQHKKCSYLNAMQLCDYFEKEAPNQSFFKPLPSWNWKTAEFIVVDDVAVTNPNYNHIDPNEMRKSLNNENFKVRNCNILLEKKMIWVFGQDDIHQSKFNEWKNLLQQIGVKEKNIIAIDVQPVKE